ncbi:Muscle-specific protein 20 [Phlyctochytrium planicorne]|nr:Muscle-specific protein 20 [Phlyctochytrium planicorne]
MSEEVVGGLDRDLAAKHAAKYDPQREAEARSWIEEVLNEPFPNESFQESLKDGQILCRLVNVLQPAQNVKFSNSKLAFKQMENISNFLIAIEKIGVKKAELFQTVDLYESKNIVQVIDCIYALSRNASAQGYNGPRLGPKLAEKREIHFSDEQIAQGKTVIGLQMGFAGGANQAGMSFGGRRQIADPKIPAGDESSMSQQLGVGKGTASGANLHNKIPLHSIGSPYLFVLWPFVGNGLESVGGIASATNSSFGIDPSSLLLYGSEIDGGDAVDGVDGVVDVDTKISSLCGLRLKTSLTAPAIRESGIDVMVSAAR